MLNMNIYFAVLICVFFLIYFYYKRKKEPELTDLFIIMLAAFGFYQSTSFGIDIIEGYKSLGDYSNQKEIIFFGAFGVMLVSLQTIYLKFKDV